MKHIKRLVGWAILSLIIQVGTLFILDRFIFKQSSAFESKKIELDKPYEDKINIKIPKDSSDIKISYNGKYMSYFKREGLNIIETKSGHNRGIETENKGEVMYYEWLYDRDMIVILEKVNKKGKDIIQLVTYNPKNSATTLVTEICDFKSGMKIKNITESVFTSVYYVYVSNNEGYDRCYRIDINNDKSDIQLKGAGIENMRVIPHKDRLIYDDVVNNNIYATSPNTKLKFNTNNKLRLIGIDRNDTIYVGEVIGDKISTIIYGNIDEDTSLWNIIKLDSPANSSDLFFNSKSEILVNDVLEGKVKNITTGKGYTYTGKCIDVKDDFIVVDNAGRLEFQKIKDI